MANREKFCPPIYLFTNEKFEKAQFKTFGCSFNITKVSEILIFKRRITSEWLDNCPCDYIEKFAYFYKIFLQSILPITKFNKLPTKHLEIVSPGETKCALGRNKVTKGRRKKVGSVVNL